MGSSLGHTPAERLAYLINHHDFDPNVEQEILSIIDDLETSLSIFPHELESTISIDSRQMRFNYDY